MMRRQREIILLFTILSICVEEGLSDRDPAEGGGIRVAICKPGYQPFAFLDSNGIAKGHDVVLLNMLYDKASSMAAGDPTMERWLPKLPYNQTINVSEVPFSDMLGGIVSQQWDMCLCGVYQTPERMPTMDFLPPYLNSGLRFLARSTTVELSTSELIGMVVGTPSAFGTLAIQCLALCAVIYSHLIWFYERGTNPQIGERYTDGIFDAFWLAIVTAATVGYGDKCVRTYIGKVLTMVWMFIGMFLVGVFAAALTTSLLDDPIGRVAQVATVVDINNPELYPNVKIGVSFGPAKEAMSELMPSAELRVFGTQDESIQALLNKTVDAIVEDVWQAEYLMRSKALKGTVTVNGEAFWPLDAAVVMSRPGGEEHPARALMSNALLEVMRGTGRRRFEANKKQWFGEKMTDESTQKGELRQSIERMMRDFTTSFTMLLSGMLAVWIVLALLSQRRRRVTAWRRTVLRQKLGVTNEMAETKVRKKITTWYRGVLENALGKVVTVRFLVGELNANHQKVSAHSIMRLVEEYHGGNEIDVGAFGGSGGNLPLFNRTKSGGSDGDSFKFNGMGGSGKGFDISFKGLAQAMRDSKFLGRVRSGASGKADKSTNGMTRRTPSSPAINNRQSYHPPPCPAINGGQSSFGRQPWSSTMNSSTPSHGPKPSPVPPLWSGMSRRSLITTMDSIAGCEGKNWVSPSLLDRVRAFLLCQTLDDGRDIVLTYNEIVYIVETLLMPKKMDRHEHEKFAPANKGDMTHLKEEVFAELSMMQRKLTTEVHMVPKLIGQDTRLEGLYFELWADNVREEKARRRLMHKIGSLEEETESAANGEDVKEEAEAPKDGARQGSGRDVLVVHSRTSLREVVKHMAAQGSWKSQKSDDPQRLNSGSSGAGKINRTRSFGDGMHAQTGSTPPEEQKRLAGARPWQTFSGALARKGSVSLPRSFGSRRKMSGASEGQSEVAPLALPQEDDDLGTHSASSTARPVSRFARVLSLKPQK